jgi:hypothetical protein
LPPSGLPAPPVHSAAEGGSIMFGPTHNLRALCSVIAASSSPIGDTPLDENGRSYSIFAAPQPNGTCLYYFEGKPWQPSPGYTPCPPVPMDPTFRAQGQFRDGFDTIKGCEYAAHSVFMEIRDRHGLEAARRIFAALGAEPSKSRLRQIKNDGLLDGVDWMMEDKVHSDGSTTKGMSIQAIARRYAEWWGADVLTVDKHIRVLLKNRDRRRGWCAWPKGTNR